ncbi:MULTISPECIES: BamA/TamA family outer membrane protein [unclassified Pedobacter]|uniref:translocation and assembly module lipoprotein TamL n=1 Tax=unclassified Pedobacter TaxID=2628915 RepID=UPI001D1CABAE|nr:MULTISPECIES: BamA/TamA family outer membrane protein [unclassified Pedobacter]CAH0252458.1 Outer membrane protein assembly factor BamA [Pedobacter sp. Bi36]CAH0277149.1 Outer membrane protein assembly factor BamA [Pedobacter sp. Bi126]
MRKLTRPLLFLLACLVWAACSSTKSLKPGQILYTGADVKINPDSSGKIDNEKQVKTDLEAKTRPRPNKSILGIKYKLGIYNLAGQPKKPKGFRNWLRRQGEAPVLLSEVKLKYNNDVLSSYLISEGYLQANVSGDTVVKGKKGKAIYTAVTGQRYKINKINFPPDTGALTKIINANKDKTLLKVGDYYDIDTYKNERIRIDNDLKENGYFYFSPDYLIMQVDSTIGKNLVNVSVKVKDIAPDAGLKPYTIKNINIYPNYSLRRDSTLRKLKPLQYNDFNIYEDRNTFKPRLFDRLVFFQKGEPYNRKDHNQSLNRMVNVGAFQDVRAEFLPVDSFKNNQLDLNIYLTPLKKNSLTFSVVGTSKSNNFVGSEVKVTQTTRNLFRNAEQLDLSVSGGFETQTKGTSLGKNSLSLTAEGKLTFPRFIVPFYKPNSTNAFIPKTIASLSYQMLNRGSEYTLHAVKGQYGYNFKENLYKEHNFNPISISYVSTSFPDTNTRDSLYTANPLLRTTLENQFIIGSNYNFTYTNQMEDSRRNNIYFFGGLETGGNVWGLFTAKNNEGKRTIFNIPLTQFIRAEADLRDYYKITKNLIWANRLNLGYGYAYGNSTSLPFVRQFFAGGSNDIRAFPARTLGPGTFKVKEDAIFADQGGDIKLMLNSELRFKIVSVLYGALFVDAGNIWLRKEDLGVPGIPDSGRPGSGFKLKNAFNELAVGTGAGLRVDVSIFVVRLDVAFPVRKPYLPEGQRWVFDDIAFGNKDWRKQNLIFNIGIGYPF